MIEIAFRYDVFVSFAFFFDISFAARISRCGVTENSEASSALSQKGGWTDLCLAHRRGWERQRMPGHGSSASMLEDHSENLEC